MATFSGTQTKCKVCGKTVYLMEQLIADGIIYHKACFRCSHCKGTLQLNSFASLEGVLYCKPHFDQLFKKTGSYEKSFEDAIKSEKVKEPPTESVAGGTTVRAKEEKPKQVNPLAARFGGTQEKCKVCTKTVYPLEKVSVENTIYHKFCFKCCHGGCKLTTANYRALQGKLYCKHHFNQLFMIKGNYSALTENGTATGTAAGASTTPAPSALVKAAEPEPKKPAETVAPRAVASPLPAKPSPVAKAPEPPKATPSKKDDSDDDDDDSDDDDDDDDD